MPFDERAAREDRRCAGRRPRELVPAEDEAHLAERVAGGRAVGHERIAEPWQQRARGTPARAGAGHGRGGPAGRRGGPRARAGARRARRPSRARRRPRATRAASSPPRLAADHHRVFADPSHACLLLIDGDMRTLGARRCRAARRVPAELLTSAAVRPVELALPEQVHDPLEPAGKVAAIGAERQPEQLRGGLLRRRRPQIGAVEGARQLGVARVGGRSAPRPRSSRARRARGRAVPACVARPRGYAASGLPRAGRAVEVAQPVADGVGERRPRERELRRRGRRRPGAAARRRARARPFARATRPRPRGASRARRRRSGGRQPRSRRSRPG